MERILEGEKVSSVTEPDWHNPGAKWKGVWDLIDENDLY
jgi:hypothetical protein